MPNLKLETYKNKATGTVYDYTDAAAQAALADILDGTDIDSFSDVETALATKVDKVTGKGLSTNDYDDTEKAKVAGAFPRSEQAVLGAKNLCPVISIGGRDSGSTLTYTVDTKDNTVEVDGTAATAGWAVLANTTKMIPVLSQLAGETIKFSGGLNNARHLILRLKETSSSSDIDYVSRGSDVDVPVPSNIENYNRVEILLSINVNTVCSNDILKPMLSFDGGTYVPPAMTNRELTEVRTVVFDPITEGSASPTAYINGKVATVQFASPISLPQGWTVKQNYLPAPLEAKARQHFNMHTTTGKLIYGYFVNNNLEIHADEAITSESIYAAATVILK